MIDLKNISVSYQDKVVLKDISLTVREGEKVALVGPSGAGKTTLLKKLYELQPKRSAFIHQDYAVVPQLSTFHNIYSGRLEQNSTFYNILNLIKPQKHEIHGISKILVALGMKEKLFERVAKLSGGQQQRVAVARAIYRRGGLILGDEPISSIDPTQAHNVLHLLLKNAETVIVSLHAIQFALDLFDRLVGLKAGEIQFDLPRQQVSPGLVTELYNSC